MQRKGCKQSWYRRRRTTTTAHMRQMLTSQREQTDDQPRKARVSPRHVRKPNERSLMPRRRSINNEKTKKRWLIKRSTSKPSDKRCKPNDALSPFSLKPTSRIISGAIPARKQSSGTAPRWGCCGCSWKRSWTSLRSKRLRQTISAPGLLTCAAPLLPVAKCAANAPSRPMRARPAPSSTGWCDGVPSRSIHLNAWPA